MREPPIEKQDLTCQVHSSKPTLGNDEHLQRLARQPRPTGSPAAAEARQYCASVLAGLGYQVVEHQFEYSAAVGKYGTPVAGLLAALAIALGNRAVLIITALLIVAGGRWLARRGVLLLPILRQQGVNLEARRVGAPSVWLVAHNDSKSQPIPLLVRATGIILLAIAWIGALFFPGTIWVYVGLAAAIPVVLSLVGSRSAGAVDNASGVATVLSAAAIVRDSPVGVLITDAEELGLAGARAWCIARQPAAVLNCDGVDDTGTLTLMWTPRRARRLEEALRAQASLRVMPLMPGVLVDSLAFSNAGWEAITLSHGSLGTLRRIHTRADDLAHLQGTGIESAARVLARAAITLTEQR